MNKLCECKTCQFQLSIQEYETHELEQMNDMILTELMRRGKGGFASTSWCADDVKTLKPRWSTKKCNEFLQNHSGHIIDAMITEGWLVIEHSIREDERHENNKLQRT